MPETQITARYYPTLATVLNTEELPEILGFLKEAIANLLDKIHYKDLQYSKSVYGDQAFYSLKIVSKGKLALELPGTGIFLVLNSDADDSGISSFPITIQYEWPILAYIRSFNLDNFSFQLEEFYKLALQILKIPEGQVLANAINVMVNPASSGVTSIQQFVSDINAAQGINIAVPTNDNPIPELLSSLNTALDSNTTPAMAVFSTYLLNASDLGETKAKLNVFFRSLLPTDDIETYIKKLIVPKFTTTLALNAGIEFPRTMLQPIDPNTLEVIPEQGNTGAPKAGFTFGEAIFYASSERGFGYELDLALSTTNPVMIGKTGLILEIERLKVDLSESTNIVEADLDGRPASFKGVYAEYVGVTLPKKWFNDDGVTAGVTAKISAYNLLVGTGGISGTIALETQTFRNSEGTIVNYYTDYFTFNYPIKTSHKDGTNIVITEINNHDALKTQLENFEGTQFVFPLSLTKTNGATLEFDDAAEYYKFLNTLYDSNNPNAKPRLSKRIGSGGFQVWFTAFDMTFKQNHIVESNIEGGMIIPKLKDANDNVAEIEIKGHLNDQGDFLLTASEQDGIAVNIPNVMEILIKTVELGKEGDDFFIGTSCDLIFDKDTLIGQFLGEQTIPIERLRIWSDGSIEIVGGAIAVPTNFKINLGPVEVAITGINFGSYQQEHGGEMRRYNYFGFDGAISVDPLGIDARGEGIKYYYTVDDGPFHSYIRIQTIEVDLIIPGSASEASATAIINGWLSIDKDEYAGGVSLKLPKVGISGGVDMRLRPKYPAFIIDANLEIPIPIPLAATGLGIFGFRGLIGYQYVPEKEAVGLVSGEDTWYDYYTYPERGVNIKKFSDPSESDSAKGGFALGAGVSIATYGSDSILNLRVFVLLSSPGFFMIDGRAAIISKRLGLDDSGEPPFFAFMIIGDNSIEAGGGVDLTIPQGGGFSIIDIYAEIQSGFFFDNPSAWYINLGTRETPITARILELITMQSFLMMSASGIEAGARAEFNFDKRFGPARVRAWAYIEVGGSVSFERPQIGGYAAVGGGAEVDIWIIGVYISLDLMLSAEAVKPFLLYASFRVCARIKIGFIKIKFCANVELKWEKSREVDRSPVAPLLEDRRAQAVKAVNMMTNEGFEIVDFGLTAPAGNAAEFDQAIIPLDSYIDIRFDKAVVPNEISNKIGGVTTPPDKHTDLIPPVRVQAGRELRQVVHDYSITELTIKAFKGGQWVDYHPYQAVDPSQDLSHLKVGHWQKAGEGYNAIRLLASSPFSYTEQGEPGWFTPEQYGITPGTLFCQGEERIMHYVDWENKPAGTTYYPGINYYNNSVYATLTGASYQNANGEFVGDKAVVVSKPNTFGFGQSLELHNSGSIALLLPQPSVKVQLKLTTAALGVTIKYYKAEINDNEIHTNYEFIDQVTKTAEQLNTVVVIDSENQPISKIVIEPEGGNASDLAEIAALEEQIAQLFEDTYLQLFGTTDTEQSVAVPLDVVTYNQLLQQLQTLKSKSCNNGISNKSCVKNTAICTIYDAMKVLEKQCFIDVKQSSDYKQHEQCYKDFSAHVSSVLGLVTSGILSNLKRDYESKLASLFNSRAVDSALVTMYQEFKEIAQVILWTVNELGDCNCEQELTFNSIQSKIASYDDRLAIAGAQTKATELNNSAIYNYYRTKVSEARQQLWCGDTGTLSQYTATREVRNFVHSISTSQNMFAIGSSLNDIAQNYGTLLKTASNGEVVDFNRYESVQPIISGREHLLFNDFIQKPNGNFMINGYVKSGRSDYKSILMELTANGAVARTVSLELSRSLGDLNGITNSNFIIPSTEGTHIVISEVGQGITINRISAGFVIEKSRIYRNDARYVNRIKCMISDGAGGCIYVLEGKTIGRTMITNSIIHLDKDLNTLAKVDFHQDGLVDMIVEDLLLLVDNRLAITGTLPGLNDVFVGTFTMAELNGIQSYTKTMMVIPNRTAQPKLKLAHNHLTNQLVVTLNADAYLVNTIGNDYVTIVNAKRFEKLVNGRAQTFTVNNIVFEGDKDHYHVLLNNNVLGYLDNQLESCITTNISIPRPRMTQKQVNVTSEVVDNRAVKLVKEQVSAFDFYLGKENICKSECPEKPIGCYTLLHQVGWLNVFDYQYNLNIPGQAAIQADYQASVDAITKVVDPIWKPNTKYLIHFKLKDTVDFGAGNHPPYNYYYGFKTAGPLGHYHNAENVTYGNEYNKEGELLNRADSEGNIIPDGKLTNPDQYPLTTLRPYIDYKRSYPNADGSLLQAKPLFYADAQLSIFFVKSYVTHMLNGWQADSNQSLEASYGAMNLVIKDPILDVLIPYPLTPDMNIEEIPSTIEAWTVDTEPLMPTYLQQWINLAQTNIQHPGHNCLAQYGDAIKPASLIRTVTLKNLKPLKMYTAIVNNHYGADEDTSKEAEVHNYVFQTSRYSNFEDQVNSYKLSDANGNATDAIFNMPITPTATEVNEAYDLVNGNMDSTASIATQYLDAYDRVTEGVLGFKPVDPPISTEFNLLKDSATGNLIGIIIRNPEPFNDPKIPLEELTEAPLEVLHDGVVSTDYKILYSKDYSQILLMNTAKNITRTQLDFRFRYFRWNGNNYEVVNTIDVSNISLTE